MGLRMFEPHVRRWFYASPMKWPELEAGDSVAGLVHDGSAYLGATLRVDKARGVIVEVAYLPSLGTSQFAEVEKWFAKQSPPPSLILLTPEGPVSLFEIEWSAHSENWGGAKSSVGVLRPGEAVFAVPDKAIPDELRVHRVVSHLDGVTRWSRASSIKTDRETDDRNRIQAIDIHLTGGPLLSWKQGDAIMELSSSWTHEPTRDGVENRVTLADFVTLNSSFENSRPFWDHFVEQRKVANLVAFIFGAPISFRRHQVIDPLFPARYGGQGEVYDVPARELISRHTFRDRLTPPLIDDHLAEPLVPLAAIGANGLSRWSDSYEDWSRFLTPAAGVIGRREAYVEDVVLSTSISLEAGGALLGPRAGEEIVSGRRPTMATHVFRCLTELGVEWPESIASIAGLAKAIANAYNDLKHADRGDFPDSTETWLISRVNRFIVRAIAVSLTMPPGELRPAFQHSRELNRIAELFAVNQRTIDTQGKWLGAEQEATA